MMWIAGILIGLILLYILAQIFNPLGLMIFLILLAILVPQLWALFRKVE